jgi:short-subunit dehydrogenase
VTVALRGLVCLVTGATGGIGRAVAELLGARGASLVLTARDGGALATLAAATGGRALAADLTDMGELEGLVERVGPVDVVVHAAGEGHLGVCTKLEPERLEHLVALNVTAPIELTDALLPGMLARGRGHVVFVGSIAGRVGRGREAAYAATKAAVSVFADSLRAEVRGTGVKVLLVTPGAVATRFFERRGTPYDRRWPRPVPAERVAEALVDGIESGRAEITVPRWLDLPVRLRGAAPGLFRELAARFD